MREYNKVETFKSDKGNYIKNRDNIRLLTDRQINLFCPDMDCKNGNIINCPGDNQSCCCDDSMDAPPTEIHHCPDGYLACRKLSSTGDSIEMDPMGQGLHSNQWYWDCCRTGQDIGPGRSR